MADGLTELAKMMTRPDPLLDFKWVVSGALPFENDEFTDPHGSGSFRYKVDSSYVESIELPFNNVGTDSVFAGSGYTIFPTFHTIAGFTMNIYADSEGNAMKWIQSWKSRVKNFSSGVYYPPSNYKRDMVVQLLDTTGKPVVQHTLVRCWPESTSAINLEYTGGGKLAFSQTFTLDDTRITFLR